MREHSRRSFVGSLSSVAAASFTPSFASLLAGCRQQSQAQIPSDPEFEPGYLKLHRTGELHSRGQELWQIMQACTLCPRQCGARRLDGETGFCGGTSQLVTAAFNPHFGEEDSLVGQNGSGTVFFSNCNLRCVFCINWQTSQGDAGSRTSLDALATMMLRLQEMGCHNINIVTPSHYSPHVVLGLDIAASRGLRVPLVYNTNGWERPEILALLDGIVDIYLPDFKYTESAMASKYSSGAASYPAVTKSALLEMHRQVGVARPADDGLMYRGLMIRHLVMPNDVGGSKEVMSWIAGHLPLDTYVNIMSQYRPMYKASQYPEIARPLNRGEYREVVEHAEQLGLSNLDIQRMSLF